MPYGYRPGQPDGAGFGSPPAGHPAAQQPAYRDPGYRQAGQPVVYPAPVPAPSPPRYQERPYQPIGHQDVLTYGYAPDYVEADAYGPLASSLGTDTPVLDDGAAQRGNGTAQRGNGTAQRGNGTAQRGNGTAQRGYGLQSEPADAEFLLHWPSESGPQSQIEDGPRGGYRKRRFFSVLGSLAIVLAVTAALGPRVTARLLHPAQGTGAAGASHTLATPDKIGNYPRDQQAEQQLDISHSEQYLTQMDPGHISGIVAAVYDTGGPASSPYHVAVLAGRLRNSPQDAVVKSFMQQERAEGNSPAMIPAGPLGGRAACAGKGKSGICLWVDSDTVGVLVSATMNATSLSHLLPAIRSGVELPAA